MEYRKRRIMLFMGLLVAALVLCWFIVQAQRYDRMVVKDDFGHSMKHFSIRKGTLEYSRGPYGDENWYGFNDAQGDYKIVQVPDGWKITKE